MVLRQKKNREHSGRKKQRNKSRYCPVSSPMAKKKEGSEIKYIVRAVTE
jgi:hypothetical protein